MVGKFITAILCLAVVSFALINFGGKLEVEREEAIETVALGSLALRDKLAEFSKPENPDSHFSSLRLDLPANSKSEIEIQAFDGHVDVIGSVAFLNANGEQVLLPRKFLADIRINSVSDEEGWYRQRGHDPEPLIARSIKWQLSLLGEEADKERFEIQKKWIRGACWVSNATSNEVPSFDTSEPGLVTTRKVWIAKRNLYPWQRFSKIDACLEDRNIAELPPDPAFVDLVSAHCSLKWHSGLESGDVIRAYHLRFPGDGIPNTNFQTGPIGLSSVSVIVDFERTPFNFSPMPRRWDVVGEFYKSPMRLIQGAKAKRVVARNARIFVAVCPYSHYSDLDDKSTTLVTLLVNDIEKSKYVAARKIQSGNFWLVPAGSVSYDDLFKDPPGLDEHVNNIYATRSSHVSTKKVLVANRDLKNGDTFNEYNIYLCDVPETFLKESIAKDLESVSAYGRKVKQSISCGDILSPDAHE